jgi:lipopolysaccharide export system protein LptA
MLKKFLIVLISALIFSIPTYAAKKTSSNKEKKPIPTVIEADELTYIQKERKAIYKGNVVVKRGDVTILANRMDVYFDEEGDVIKIIAVGNVRIYKKPDREGRGDKAIYDKKRDTIELIGNAYLKQGKNVVEGERIIHYITKEITEVKGAKKRRVKTIIFETKKKDEGKNKNKRNKR